MSATASNPSSGAPRAGTVATPSGKVAPSTSVGGAPSSTVPTAATALSQHPTLEKVLASLTQMSEDPSLPRNIRRGAQAARETLSKVSVAVDVRVAGAVGQLDDLANDSNLPVHGRTAIWSLISQLESLQ